MSMQDLPVGRRRDDYPNLVQPASVNSGAAMGRSLGAAHDARALACRPGPLRRQHPRGASSGDRCPHRSDTGARFAHRRCAPGTALVLGRRSGRGRPAAAPRTRRSPGGSGRRIQLELRGRRPLGRPDRRRLLLRAARGAGDVVPGRGRTAEAPRTLRRPSCRQGGAGEDRGRVRDAAPASPATRLRDGARDGAAPASPRVRRRAVGPRPGASERVGFVRCRPRPDRPTGDRRGLPEHRVRGPARLDRERGPASSGRIRPTGGSAAAPSGLR